MILGTAAYMSPEQARGKPADKRSDIWAFGCVLYEMLSGKRAFQGEDISETLALVLTKDPDWTSLPASVPASVRALLMRCMERDRQRRVADISTVLFVLDEAASIGAEWNEAGQVPRRGLAGSTVQDRASVRSVWRRALPAIVTAVAAAVAAGGAMWWTMRPAPPRVLSEVTTAGATALSISGFDRDLAITPDGSRVVYRGNNQLLVRALDQLEPDVLSGLGAPRGVFVSPDGQWVGFFDGVHDEEGRPDGRPTAHYSRGSMGTVRAGPRGGRTERSSTRRTAASTGLQRVSAAGGDPTVLTKPNRERGEADHLWPEFLPGGQAVLFTISAATGGLDNAQIAVSDLETGTPKCSCGEATTRTIAHGPSCLRRRRHAARGGVRPRSARGRGVRRCPSSNRFRDVRRRGRGCGRRRQRHDGVCAGPRWARSSPIARLGRPYGSRGAGADAPARLLLSTHLAGWHARGARRHGPGVGHLDLGLREGHAYALHLRPGDRSIPVWSPDSRRVVFGAGPTQAQNLFWRSADGIGLVQRLTESPSDQDAQGVTPDGRPLIFRETKRQEGSPSDLMLLPLAPTGSPSAGLNELGIEGASKARPLIQTSFSEENGEVSPDGEWLAYESNESGRSEIYVRPFPNIDGGRWQVSTLGGRTPLWSRDGQELFYLTPEAKLMGVRVERGPVWRSSTPTQVLQGQYDYGAPGTGRTFDIAPDGRRFLMIKQAGVDEAAPQNIVVAQNWTEELKRLVPVP